MAEKREMTEEVRRQLAGHMCFSNESTTDFPPSMYLKHKQKFNEKTNELEDTLEYEVAEDLHGYFPTFQLRSFTKGEYEKSHRISEEIRLDKNSEHIADRIPKIRELARVITMGWTDFYDPGKNEVVTYKSDPQGGCDKDLFRMVTDGRANEIYMYGCRMSGIFQGEKLSLRLPQQSE